MSRLKNLVLPGAILLLFFFHVSPYLSKPFIGHHDWNSVVYTNAARNYVRYGLWTTKLGQVRNPDITSPEVFNFITHYPPLLSLLTAGSLKIFGMNETAARLVPVSASLITILMIYALSKDLLSKDVGVLAALFALVSPILTYFSLIPVHETVVPAFVLLTVYFYVKWIKTKHRYFAVWSLVWFTLGSFVNWSTYYIVPPLIIHYVVFSRTSKKSWVPVSFVLVCILTFILFFAHIKLLTGTWPLADFVQKFSERANPLMTQNLYGYSLPTYIFQELRYFKIYFSLPMVVGAFIWLTWQLFYWKKVSWQHGIILVLGVYGVTQLILFQQLSFIHDYMIIYSLPFITLSAAYVWNKVFKRLGSLPGAFLTCVLIGIIIWSTSPFTNALLQTDTNERGRQVGLLLNTKTESGKTSLITSSSYKEFQEVFITYYADRNVEYGSSLPEDFASRYRLVVIPKDHAELTFEDKTLLETMYQRTENDRFIWYDLTQPKAP